MVTDQPMNDRHSLWNQDMSHTRALVYLLLPDYQSNLIMACHLCDLFNHGPRPIMHLPRRTLLYNLMRQSSTSLRQSGEAEGDPRRPRLRQTRGLRKHEVRNILHQRPRGKERTRTFHRHYHRDIRIKDQPHHLWYRSSSLHKVRTSAR